jgi:hypothetical protein
MGERELAEKIAVTVAAPVSGRGATSPFGLSEIRDRLEQKSNTYFTFTSDRFKGAKGNVFDKHANTRNVFCGAMDALLDSSSAARNYGGLVEANAGRELLVCYGFLQALYIQQDAVHNLSKLYGSDWKPEDDPQLCRIRDLRNRLTGHPALAGEKGKKETRILSSAIISSNSITVSGFRGQIYYDDRSESVEVKVSALLIENEERLALRLLEIEKMIDAIEQQFRAKQSAQPFSMHFENRFSYLLQRLRCNLDDVSRKVQAETHAKMIREVVLKLRQEFEDETLSQNTVWT